MACRNPVAGQGEGLTMAVAGSLTMLAFAGMLIQRVLLARRQISLAMPR